MSIYATLWEIGLPKRHHLDEEFEAVYAQAVPAHIGHPSQYPDGDPYGDFLPPVVEDYDPESEEWRYRAVLIVAASRSRKEVQKYVDPLMVLTWDEYARLRFDELIQRIEDAMDWDRTVCGFKYVDGKRVITRHSDLSPKLQAALAARKSKQSISANEADVPVVRGATATSQ